MRATNRYLGINKFAEYEGVTPRTIKNWIQKGKVSAVKGTGKSKYRKNHPEVNIYYSQLSTAEEQEKFLRDRGLLPSEEKKPENSEFSELKPWRKRVVDKRQVIVREYLNATKNAPKGKLLVVKRHFGKSHNINYRTLDRWTEAYKSGGYYALVPAWSPGNQEKLIDQEMAKFIESKYLIPFGPPAKVVFEDLVKEFRDKREKLPAYRTIADFINSKWTKSQQLLIRNKEEWNRLYSPHVRRDWSKVKLNECWIADSKQIDLAVLFRDKPIFPWFTAFLDARSRKFVGWILTPIHDSWTIAQSFVYAVSIHGTPQTIYVDRGKPYKSYMIAGGKLRTGKVVSLFKDIEETTIPGIFRDLGCEIFFASAYNAREKIIEPNFKIFTQRLRHLSGYRGHSVKTRPKKLEQEIKSGKLLSLEELENEINRVIKERNARPHSTTGKSPDSFYENYIPIIPSQDILAYLLMDQNYALVKDSTVSIKGLIYRGEELWKLAGERVEVRRAPKDIRRAAIIYNGKLFEFASLETPSHYRDGITLESVKTATRIRKRITKWRKAVIEHEGVIDDPLKFAVELDEKEKLRARDIRPVDSKVRSLHKRERLAKDVLEGLQNQEIKEDQEQVAAVANKPSMWDRYMSALAKKRTKEETPKPRLRLIPRERLTMYDDED